MDSYQGGPVHCLQAARPKPQPLSWCDESLEISRAAQSFHEKQLLSPNFLIKSRKARVSPSRMHVAEEV